MTGVVLIVAIPSGYWPAAGRHSPRGDDLRERDNRPDRSGSRQSWGSRRTWQRAVSAIL